MSAYRWEDTDGPHLDDPRSLDVFRGERDWLGEETPTLAEAEADERELREWPPKYSDGNGQ